MKMINNWGKYFVLKKKKSKIKKKKKKKSCNQTYHEIS